MEYTFDCEVVGEGHPGGGLSIACASRPRIGAKLCVSFPSSQQVGALVVGFSPPLRPSVPLMPPLVCKPGDLWASPDPVFDALGDPGTVCIPIPNDPGLVDVFVVMQGLALNAAQCLDLTDAIVAVVQP